MFVSVHYYSLSLVYEGSCRLLVAADRIDQCSRLTWAIYGERITFEVEKHVRPVILEHLGY